MNIHKTRDVTVFCFSFLYPDHRNFLRFNVLRSLDDNKTKCTKMIFLHSNLILLLDERLRFAQTNEVDLPFIILHTISLIQNNAIQKNIEIEKAFASGDYELIRFKSLFFFQKKKKTREIIRFLIRHH